MGYTSSEVIVMRLAKQTALFCLGGIGYIGLELLWRGWSHVSMFAAGGVCFLLVGHLEEVHPALPRPLRPVAGALIITMVELASGLVVNRSYSVWDYRGHPGNFLGQICPLFTLLWIPVSYAAGRIYRALSPRLDRAISFTKSAADSPPAKGPGNVPEGS